MKNALAIAVLSLFATDSFADDWRMNRHDVNSDGVISKKELVATGCNVKPSLFRTADKNRDGVLNRKEAKQASFYIFREKCKGIQYVA